VVQLTARAQQVYEPEVNTKQVVNVLLNYSPDSRLFKFQKPQTTRNGAPSLGIGFLG